MWHGARLMMDIYCKNFGFVVSDFYRTSRDTVAQADGELAPSSASIAGPSLRSVRSQGSGAVQTAKLSYDPCSDNVPGKGNAASRLETPRLLLRAFSAEDAAAE
jgi:hypothetical protein